MTNPLLDFSGLPRFPEIKPEHVTPAVDELLARKPRRWWSKLVADAAPPALGRLRARRWTMPTSGLSRAWGQVSHLQCGDGQPGTARGLQRQPAQDHRRTTPTWRRTWRLFDKYKALAASPEFAALSAGAQEDRRQRIARFRARRRRTAGGQEAALQGDPGGTVHAVRQVRGKPARRHQCLGAVRRRRRRTAPAFPTMRCRRAQRGGAKPTASRAGSSPCTVPSYHAGDAVLRKPRPARADVPRLRHARLRVRQAGTRTTPR